MPKISELTAGIAPDGTETAPVVQDGVTVGLTINQILQDVENRKADIADLAPVALSGSGSDISSGNMGLTTLIITGGSLASGTGKALNITGTMSATSASQSAVQYSITSAGTDANPHVGLQANLAAGYTGAGSASAVTALNQAAGTGVTAIPASGSNAQLLNTGVSCQAAGATAGYNTGVLGKATGSTALNIGVLGLSQTVANGAKNIGGAFSAINTGTSPVQVGIWASLNQTTLPSVSAALIADNGAQTDPIARFQDNGTDVLSINDGGTVTMSSALVGSLRAGLGVGQIAFWLPAANFNSTSDQAIIITLPTGYTRYRIQAVLVSNPSTSLTTAAGGFYTAATKGGTAFVAAATAYSALTNNTASASGSLANLTVVNANTAFYNAGTLYLSLSTPQGSTATADVTILINPLP